MFVRAATLGAALMLTTTATQAQTSPPLRTDCIWIYQVRSIDPRHYDVSFQSGAPVTTPISLEFPTRSTVLAVDLDEVGITRRSSAPSAPFVSGAIRVENPTDEPFLAARIVSANGRCFEAGACLSSGKGNSRIWPADRAAQARLTGGGGLPPDCNTPFRGAYTVKKAEADYPDAAIRVRAQGTVTILLALDEQGNVTDSNVYRSSGNADLDAAARRAATTSKYAPKIEYCRKVPGKYMFVVDFMSQ